MSNRISTAHCALLFLAALTGCAHEQSNRVYTAQRWRETGGSLGKVMLVVVGPESYQSEDDPNRIAAIFKEALQKLPATTVVDLKSHAAWRHETSDRESIVAAQAAGADSVCCVSLANYSGQFSIGIPILWSCESHVAYSLRLLDVQTGDLLAHSISYRHMGGWFEICDPTDTDGSLRKLLKQDLAAPKRIQS
jgi:hypothetical protein